MGLKLCFFVMNVRGDARPRRPILEAMPNLLELWLADFFAPRVLNFWLDGTRAYELARLDPTQRIGTQPLWTDETVIEASALTHCGPAGSSPLIAEAREFLAEHSPGDLYLHAEGALHHLAHDDTEPHWYGRWFSTSPPTLSGLIEIRFEWSRERRNLEISFPASGYPLTSATLLRTGELGPGDPRVAAANRALLVPALSRAPAALGLSAADVHWTVEGDFSGLYREDATALHEWWLPALRSGELDEESQRRSGVIEPMPTGDAKDDANTADILRMLAAGGPQRVWQLEDLIRRPVDNPGVVAAIEATLDDRTPCRIEQYFLGEVRLLAGLALLTERAVQGEAAPLRLRCVPPVTTGDLMALLEAVGIAWPEPAGDEDAALIAFGLARDRGIVVEEELELRFPVDLAALAAAWRPSVALQQDHGPATSADPVAGPDARSPATVRAATEEDVRYYLDVLTRGERDDRVFALRNLAGAPTGDARVRLALEPLLADTTPCVLQIPYRFGELRLLAGAALAAERWAAGDEQPVRLRCVAPLTPDELEALRYAAGAPLPPPRTDPIEQQLELFALLRDRRLMPELELELRHPVHIGWLGVQSSLPS